MSVRRQRSRRTPRMGYATLLAIASATRRNRMECAKSIVTQCDTLLIGCHASAHKRREVGTLRVGAHKSKQLSSSTAINEDPGKSQVLPISPPNFLLFIPLSGSKIKNPLLSTSCLFQSSQPSTNTTSNTDHVRNLNVLCALMASVGPASPVLPGSEGVRLSGSYLSGNQGNH